jgi:uncharacterized membrane protein YhhN
MVAQVQRDVIALPLVLIILSLACSVLYTLTLSWQPWPGSAWVKAGSVFALAILASRARLKPPSHGLLLSAALALSSLGDLLLDLDPAKLFIAGLAAFLIAHLVYIALFLRYAQRWSAVPAGRLAGICLALVYAASFAVWLVPSLGALAVPVIVYMAAITMMVTTAGLARFAQSTVFAGGLLFLVSDSLLAANRFKTPVPLHDYLIWITYYLAQYLIATGFLRDRTGSPAL